MKLRTLGIAAASALFAVSTAATGAKNSIPVGGMLTFTGPTSDVGQPYGQAIKDSIAYINEHGGINGKKINFEWVDYGYEIPRAISAYKQWQSSLHPVAILGWGTSDTEALVPFVTKDTVVYLSASYSGHLTDPTGEAKHSEFAAPYNFFVSATYSDACRAQTSWAMQDWKASGNKGKAQWVYMGADHPYPNAPKPACTAWAKKLGFDVLPNITYSLTPSDFKAQCLALKKSGADYAYLGNTAASSVALMKACDAVGTDVQFMTNAWGWDENSAQAAGAAGDGTVFPALAVWGEDVPGMKTARAISKMSDPDGSKHRVLGYIRGICSAFVLRDALRMADNNDEVTSESVKAALETMKNHVPNGLKGVCAPVTFTPTSHRPVTKVTIYQNQWNNGSFEFKKLTTIDLPRGEKYLGW